MRVRVVYSKGDKVRFLGHLDVARIVQMSVRRAAWPVKMSEGYAPKPKIAFYSPLPVGTAGEEELFDVVLDEVRPVISLARTLSASLPAGFLVKEVRPVAPGDESLETRIHASEYLLDLKGVDKESLSGAFLAFMGERSVFLEVLRSKKNQTVDLRPFVVQAEVLALQGLGEGRVQAVMVIRHESGRTVRPQWVLESLARFGMALDPREAIIDRRKILFEQHRGDPIAGESPEEKGEVQADEGKTEDGGRYEPSFEGEP